MSGDVWDNLFRIAEVTERDETTCELVSYWHVETTGFEQYRIERIIPLYPFSRDRAKRSSLLRTRAIHRLAFGQPRQSELIEHLLRLVPQERLEQVRSRLMIDLSPISYRSESAHRSSSPATHGEAGSDGTLSLAAHQPSGPGAA